MHHHSILDRSSTSLAVEGDMSATAATRSATASVSAGIAAANAHLPNLAEPGPRFPGEDGGRSLFEMAHSDLDAALQLLAERAEYITGASGAAIALRRSQHHDMLCRASTGSTAPELGSLLSMEYGLSGQSVRTQQALRCDDADRDPRVNREGCRQLGIASVLVMPIVSEQQVLGVFELFSGKPHAFEQRDISALQRLSEMVETAVKRAVATDAVPPVEEPAGIVVETVRVESPASVLGPGIVQAPPVKDLPPPEPETTAPQQTEREKTKPETNPTPQPAPAPKKPLFWSAAMQTQSSAGRTDQAAASIAVPPVLRNLQKCQACGFPVSQGRTFCVECEEKQWRGQRLPPLAVGPASARRSSQPGAPASGESAISGSAVAVAVLPEELGSAQTEAAAITLQASVASSEDVPDPHFLGSDNSAPSFGSALQSESWFAANKYILGALLVAAIVIGAIVWLR
jgi:hypothetical protein